VREDTGGSCYPAYLTSDSEASQKTLSASTPMSSSRFLFGPRAQAHHSSGLVEDISQERARGIRVIGVDEDMNGFDHDPMLRMTTSSARIPTAATRRGQ